MNQFGPQYGSEKHQETTLRLNNGVYMPKLGLGTFRASGESLVRGVMYSLEVGYRLIDTAAIYRNESEIAAGISQFCEKYVDFGISKKDIFLTSKLAPTDQGFDSTIKAVETSLQNLRTDVIDLYLIHWPGKSKLDPKSPLNRKARKESWLALEQLYRAGKIRAIGVSNYTINHLQEMKDYATIRPAVLQNEFHPYLYDESILEYCQNNHIQFESYASLGEGNLLNDDTVLEIAKKYDRTPAQILLRWGLEHGTIVIPKTVVNSHIEENFKCLDFQLKFNDLKSLNGLSSDSFKRFCWDPNKVA